MIILFKIPLDDIINIIKTKSNVTEEEINTRIEKKLKQLSGLISREGAAHIIANELGVKLFDQYTGKVQIKNILPGMRDVETVGKVQQTFDVREFQTENRSGKVGNFILGDETGTIRVVIWGNQADDIKNLNKDTLVKIKSGYIRENQGRKEIHLNDRSKLIINPPGEKIGEVKPFTVKRKKINDLQENDENIELLGTIVQVFEPRFFEVCPECNKRLKQIEGSFVCDTHKNITAEYSYVLNLVLDDSTETIRTVFFRQQLENLLNKNKEQLLVYRSNPEKFEEIRTELLGKIIKVNGRAVKNTMFERLEFITNRVFPNPDPKEEIEKLKQEKPSEKEPEKEVEISTEEVE